LVVVVGTPQILSDSNECSISQPTLWLLTDKNCQI
jgi:hypothetical protein